MYMLLKKHKHLQALLPEVLNFGGSTLSDFASDDQNFAELS